MERYTLLLLLISVVCPVSARRRHLTLERAYRNLTETVYEERRAVEVPKPTTPDDHLVDELPLLQPGEFPGDHWAGLLPASADGDKYFFYHLFAPDQEDEDDEDKEEDEDIPLLIWLNGGPACSSMDGLWLENGPLRLVLNGTTKAFTIEGADFSWHEAPAYTLYIDQPVGTGLSFTTSKKYPTNDEEVNIDFYYFLTEFLQLHADKFLEETNEGTQLRVKRPFFMSGESHAGHYIPSMMNYIRKRNAEDDVKVLIPLSGAAIGNGWVDPRYQYSAHEAAYGIGLIGRAQMHALAEQEKTCQALLNSGKYVNTACYALLDAVVNNSQGKGAMFKVSEYDNRKWESVMGTRDFPPGHKIVEAYLGGAKTPPLNPDIGVDTQDVLKALHALPSWESGQRIML